VSWLAADGHDLNQGPESISFAHTADIGPAKADLIAEIGQRIKFQLAENDSA
jgi:hypothetical protein